MDKIKNDIYKIGENLRASLTIINIVKEIEK
jgi:hypothetical protein